MTHSEHKVILITGSAKRVGAAIAKALHKAHYNIVIHYRHSKTEAKQLVTELNQIRKNSAIAIQADLNNFKTYQSFIEKDHQHWGRLDVLINNASSFYSTPLGNVDEQQLNDLMASNLKAPFFLSQAAMPYLQQHQGCIINIADVNGIRPIKTFSVYCTAKAALITLTKSLAIDLAPDIRVNAIAPGTVLKQKNADRQTRQNYLKKTLLKRKGNVNDVMNAILYLIQGANHMTGEVLVIDGGKLLA